MLTTGRYKEHYDSGALTGNVPRRVDWGGRQADGALTVAALDAIIRSPGAQDLRCPRQGRRAELTRIV